MLSHIRIQGFKSLEDVSVDLPKLAVIFGPNDSGKSNFLDALKVLSGLELNPSPLSQSLRGYPIEQFAFSSRGLRELLKETEVRFRFDASIIMKKLGTEYEEGPLTFDYGIGVGLNPKTGTAEIIEKTIKNHDNDYNYSDDHLWEFGSWETYYLEPSTMRESSPPHDVENIGSRGENLIAFLNKMAMERRSDFDTVIRNLRTIIPTVDDLIIELDEKRGILNLSIIEDGIPYSSRIISEGTLRILALCAISINPWRWGGLVGIEEPENGVHPRRLENIVNLLTYMAFSEDCQVIITTHSPRLVSMMNKLRRENREMDIGLFVCRREHRATKIYPFKLEGKLSADGEIVTALQNDKEDQIFEAMLLRGWIDG